MRVFTLLLFSAGTFCLFGQVSMNMSLRHNWNDATLPFRSGLKYNDIWGYADPDDAREYAIMGSVAKVHFFDITNPDSPVEVAAIAGGASSLWRDMKTYGKYAYSVADEGAEGLMVFDLDNLPASVSKVLQTTEFFSRCHNIYVETATGRLYAAGCNTRPNGLIVLDLTANPAAPALLADVVLPGGYVHDVYVRNNIAFCSHGYSGLYAYDMTNAAAPVWEGALYGYSQAGYNHSSWLNEAGTRLVFCDETHGSSIKIADVSMLNNMSVISLFKSAMLAPAVINSIAHNPFIKGDSVFISYYHEGVQVFDISNPADVQRVAYYDTNPTNTNYNGYDGAWGVYPYLPSGNIIASDTKNGLFVLSFPPAAPLPVEWGGLSAKKDGAKALLQWNTVSERNNAAFELERSPDAVRFYTIARLTAAGNSHTSSQYTAVDNLPLPGRNYYRIRQIDHDGNFSFSEMVELSFDLAGKQPALFPAILYAGEECYLLTGDLDSPFTRFRITDLSGRVLHTALLDLEMGAGSFSWPLHLNRAGIYFIQAGLGNTAHTFRVFVR